MRMLCLLLTCFALSACGRSSPPAPAIAVGEALSGDAEGFARAVAPRPFVFPADHGPHPAYRSEWWYFTGNLRAADGRRFGFQLTLFRNAIAPDVPTGESAWRTNQVYMAHFAVTDVAGRRFVAHERFARAAIGLAGARAEPLRVWVEDWRVDGKGDPFPLTLTAESEDAAIALTLDSGKPPVLQGEAGLSRKSAEPGNASYYYSMPRLPVTGTLRLGTGRVAVSGEAWLDREWSTSALASNQQGWDWFALQLDNHQELMFYRLRRRDGTTDPASAGSLIRPDGGKQGLDAGDLQIAVTSHWQSPHGGRYPAGWRLTLPAEGLDLVVTPLLADQELALTVRYWEGAVAVRGTRDGRPVSGQGYVELTGYAE